jgi:hypothetical protein
MIKQKIILGLFLALALVSGFNPEKITARIETILDERRGTRIIQIINGFFDDNGNLWVSWHESDRHVKDWRNEKVGQKYYSYWYIQKFDSTGMPCFPAVEMVKGEQPFGGAACPIYPGNSGDVYAFRSVIERVDSKGNHYTSSEHYDYFVHHMFIDKHNIMYAFGNKCGTSGRSNVVRMGPPGCLKFRIQPDSFPTFLEEQILPGWDNPEGDKYRWIGSNLIYCNAIENYVLFLRPPNQPQPPAFERPLWIDTTKINVYRVSLPDLMSIDTSSFQTSDALFKKIKGCKLRTQELTSRGWEPRWVNVSTLLEGRGDTLILFLSSRGGDEDVIYVCKLTKDGKDIKTEAIIEEQVKHFDQAPAKLYREIIFQGYSLSTGGYGPDGIMIYGFDKLGNVYYHVWNKSDDYWRE